MSTYAVPYFEIMSINQVRKQKGIEFPGFQ